MPWDITLQLENRPGTLADAGEAAARAGVNLEGGCGFPCEGVGILHVLVEDVGAGRSAFEAAGIPVVGEREVLVTHLEDRPGAMGALTRRCADAGINVDLLYLAHGDRVVLGVEDLEAARAVI